MGRWMSAICVVAVLTAAAQAAPKVDELVIAPADKVIGSVAISPAGLHAGAVINKGSRVVVTIDGVEGPKLDQMLTPDGRQYLGAGNAPILFSDDGSRSAYAAKVGNEIVVFADGKELVKVPFNSSGLPGALQFAPNGKLLTFTARAGGGGFNVYVDDKPGPTSVTTPELVFSPDGAHYAYAGMEADGKTKWAVVDGRHVKYIGDKLRYTSNGHVVGIADGKNGQAMVIDGKAVMVAAQINPVWISETGVIIAAQVVSKTGGPPMLVVDGKPVPGTEGLGVNEVVFSPDGKRYAAVCYSQNATQCLVVDGKKGQDYTTVMKPRFTADSSKVIYQAQTNQKFLVINDEESDGYGIIDDPLVAGSRIAYTATPTNYQGKYVVIDGKATKLQNVFHLAISRDGSRYAYIGDAGKGGNTLWVDGAEVPGLFGLTLNNVMRDPDPTPGQSRQGNKVGTTGSVVFSPDNKHYACLGSVPAKGNFVFLNGKQVGQVKMPTLQWIAFTPDSKHLMWLDQTELFIDGQSVVKFTTSATDNAVGNFAFQPDGSFGVIAKVGDSYKRLKITPGEEDGVAALLAAAK